MYQGYKMYSETENLAPTGDPSFNMDQGDAAILSKTQDPESAPNSDVQTIDIRHDQDDGDVVRVHVKYCIG